MRFGERRRINSLGVARWYGADEEGWTVSLDGLARWFPSINELAVPRLAAVEAGTVTDGRKLNFVVRAVDPEQAGRVLGTLTVGLR